MEAEELAQLRSWFKGYADRYLAHSPGSRNGAIFLKRQHTWRVCREIRYLGRALGLCRSELQLAEAAALLHDVGRFPQWRCFGTFVDADSTDHGLLGVEVIERHRLLSGLGDEERRCLLAAVRYHNHRSIPVNMPATHMRILRMLRDADKLDIWRVVLEEAAPGESRERKPPPKLPGWSSTLVQELLAGELPGLEGARSEADMVLVRLGWLYDLNYPWTCEQVLRRNYIVRLLEPCQHLPGARQLQAHLTSYLQRRCH